MLYGIPHEQFAKHFDSSEQKDRAQPEFFGKTPRQVQIAISEDLLKPLHGQDIFGRLLVSRLLRAGEVPNRIVVVSDCGFRREAEEIVKAFGKERVFLWRLHRTGCDYSGDSRGYISLGDLGVRTVDIENNWELEDLANTSAELFRICTEPRWECEGAEHHFKRIAGELRIFANNSKDVHYAEEEHAGL